MYFSLTHINIRTVITLLSVHLPSMHTHKSSSDEPFSLRKPKVSALQILRRYLTIEGRVRKFFCNLIWIKEPCVRKFEGLAVPKILGISQTTLCYL